MVNAGAFNRALGANIRARRRAIGLSQRELAARLGYTSGSRLCLVEQGRYGLAISQLQPVADALGVTATALLPKDLGGQ